MQRRLNTLDRLDGLDGIFITYSRARVSPVLFRCFAIGQPPVFTVQTLPKPSKIDWFRARLDVLGSVFDLDSADAFDQPVQVGERRGGINRHWLPSRMRRVLPA